MNNTSIETPRKRKPKWQYFSEFCALPSTRIAEIPLSLLYLVNKWFEKVFKWLFDGPISEWMSDAKYNHPKIFWGTAIIWIPLLLVVGFYVLDLLIVGGISAVIIAIGLAISLTLICKLFHIINIIIHPVKLNYKK